MSVTLPTSLATTSGKSFGEPIEIVWETTDRRPIFTRDDKKLQAIVALHRSLKRNDFRLIGFVLLPERLHAIVVPLSRYARADLLAIDFPRRHAAQYRRDERNGTGVWDAALTQYAPCEVGGLADRLDRLHAKPVIRGLAAQPNEWAWSSYRFHRGLSGEPRFDAYLDFSNR